MIALGRAPLGWFAERRSITRIVPCSAYAGRARARRSAVPPLLTEVPRGGGVAGRPGAEGVVRIWELDLDDLVDIAEHEVTRTVTDQECRQYLHVER